MLSCTMINVAVIQHTMSHDLNFKHKEKVPIGRKVNCHARAMQGSDSSGCSERPWLFKSVFGSRIFYYTILFAVDCATGHLHWSLSP